MSNGRVENSDQPVREVVIGRNSKVWKAAAANPAVVKRFSVAIGHLDVPQFGFQPNDRVWVLSYSRRAEDNSRMLATIQAAGVREVVYVSSATTIVNRLTPCYEYPRIKQQAEEEARIRLNARILVLGLVVERFDELPSGANAATLQSWIDDFLLAPHWPHDEGTRMRLFEIVSRACLRAWEARLQRAYCSLQWSVRRWPCVLRPLDYLLRAMGIRWYGYINLSNRLWTTTTS